MLLPLSFHSPRRELLTWLVRNGRAQRKARAAATSQSFFFRAEKGAAVSEERLPKFSRALPPPLAIGSSSAFWDGTDHSLCSRAAAPAAWQGGTDAGFRESEKLFANSYDEGDCITEISCFLKVLIGPVFFHLNLQVSVDLPSSTPSLLKIFLLVQFCMVQTSIHIKVHRNATHVNPSLTKKKKKGGSDFYYVNFIGTFPSCPYIQGSVWIQLQLHLLLHICSLIVTVTFSQEILRTYKKKKKKALHL